MNDLIINFPEVVTSHSFFKEILPQLPRDESLLNNMEIMFNFTNTDKVHSESVSKIFTLGMLLNGKTGKTTSLYIPWKPSLLSELYNMGFLHFVKNEEIFELSDIGGYTPKKTIKSEIHRFSNCDEFMSIARSNTILFNFIDLFLLDGKSGGWSVLPHIMREKATRFFKGVSSELL